MYELEESKSGYITLKYDGKYIHSKYNPIKEADNFAKGNEELLKNNIIVLYGIGLGYHVKAILDIMPLTSILYVFEYNKELIKYCKNINKELFNNKNLFIITNEDEEFFNKFSKKIKESNGLIIHSQSLKTIKKSNPKLYNVINDFNIIKQYNNIEMPIDKYIQNNYDKNTTNGYIDIEEFIYSMKNTNKPFIIVSAGPSLDNNLETLKRYRDFFNIICVGSAFRSLSKIGILPDAVVIIDPEPIIAKQFRNINTKNITLCFSKYASSIAVKEFEGKKYIFDTNYIKTGGTVSIAAINIAIKCNAETIIFLGQDLAFIEEKSHVLSFEETYNFKDDYIFQSKIKKIKGVNGKLVNTNQGYIIFKNRIESLIYENNNIKFINCSNGAHIEGAYHINFDKIINNSIKFK